MAIDFIFVYGTLRKQMAINRHDLLTRYCEYFADGYMQGKLYEIDGYPGAIESDNLEDKVYGEIYKIVRNNNIVLAQLDEYEECTHKFLKPHEYIRKKIALSLSDNSHIRAWVYIFNRNTSDLIAINSGDYLKYSNALKCDN